MAEPTAADFTTVIGADVVIKGEVTVERGMRVDGRIEGAIETRGKVLVGKTGQLKAETHAGTLVIEGKVTGNVLAERVQVEASGQVFGDLAAGKLIVSEGATFVGKINVSPEALKDAPRGEAVATPSLSRATALPASYASASAGYATKH